MAFQRTLNESKYDRQMRLWGSHGQKLVEESHLLVLGSSATATETLKNLVLPNVGHFTIVDDALITEDDMSSNFFVEGTPEHLGTPRGQSVASLLMEMNSEVKGEYVHQPPIKFVESQRDPNGDYPSLTKYTFVIVSQINTLSLLPLYDYLYKVNIPVLSLHSVGFLGRCRLQMRQLAIIETHPTNDRYDFYVHPMQSMLFPGGDSAFFPEMRDYVRSFESLMWTTERNGTTSEEHAHIPSLAILSLCIEKWMQKERKPAVPKSAADKKRFKQFIIDSSWNYGEEGNFQEAYEWAFRAYELPSLDADARAAMECSAALSSNLTKSTPNFFILCNALSSFFHNVGKSSCLPVSIDLPDMHCKTEHYIRLKSIMKQKFQQQCDIIESTVRSTLNRIGRAENDISKEEIVFFVKNCRQLKLIETRPISVEYQPKSFNTSKVNEMLEEEEMTRAMNESEQKEEEEAEKKKENDMEDVEESGPIRIPNPPNFYWYAQLRAFEVFEHRHGYAPGVKDEKWEEDAKEIESIVHEFIHSHGITEQQREIDNGTVRDTSIELARYGGTELHNIAAFMGGIGSQEALKVILRQYVPVNNTYVYNGIHCSSNSWEM